MPPPRPLATLAAALVAAAALSGCLALEPARVPEAALAGAGWRADAAHSDAAPSSTAFGTTSVQKLAYRDDAADGRGYPGHLLVYTFRSLVTPSEEKLRDEVQEQVRAAVQAQGVRLDAEASRSTRAVASGATSFYFVYNGTVTQESGVFTRDARVKVLGEVFPCRAERTSVVAVGLAQVTSTRSLGGVAFPANSDPATWRELVADPAGTIEGHRGGNGLVHAIACG